MTRNERAIKQWRNANGAVYAAKATASGKRAHLMRGIIMHAARSKNPGARRGHPNNGSVCTVAQKFLGDQKNVASPEICRR